MNLGFYYYHELSLEEARELIVYVVSTCLSEINTHPEWVPYFSEYPVTEKTLDIDVFIEDSGEIKIPHDAINCVSATEGVVKYQIILPGIAPIQTVHKETYQEALSIVCSQGKEASGVECGAYGQARKWD